jgi:V-type H+-transporting ATPase subunit a
MPDDGTHIADKDDDECRYKFGLDPIWRISTNEVHFTNSLKMKISVIIGILHMIFGLLLKGSNTLYFR